MIYYILLIIAASFFGCQVFATKSYEEHCGNTLYSVAKFTAISGLVSAIISFAINGFKFEFSLGSFLLALCGAAVLISLQMSSIKALTNVNMSVYSTFLAIGGMLLPFICGIYFFSEKVTVGRIACCIIITFVTAFQCKNVKFGVKTLVYSMLVFMLNGAFSTLSTIHQNAAFDKTSGNAYNMVLYLTVSLVSGIYLIVKRKDNPSKTGIGGVISASGYGILNGGGNIILLITLLNVPASVQYPIVTGGIMIVSTIISAIRRENLTVANVVCAVIAFAALFLMMV